MGEAQLWSLHYADLKDLHIHENLYSIEEPHQEGAAFGSVFEISLTS